MASFPIFIILISTFMHAGWNLIARYEKDEHLFFRNFLIITFAVGIIPSVVAEIVYGSLPTFALMCVVASGSCCGIYYFALARAYHHGDFTTVYPMSRAVPIVLVVLFDVLRGRFPSTMGCVGLPSIQHHHRCFCGNPSVSREGSRPSFYRSCYNLHRSAAHRPDGIALISRFRSLALSLQPPLAEEGGSRRILAIFPSK